MSEVGEFQGLCQGGLRGRGWNQAGKLEQWKIPHSRGEGRDGNQRRRRRLKAWRKSKRETLGSSLVFEKEKASIKG